ncbi:IclR family transcriptional regulator [Nocardia jejuensis]|uniref:IclR family transcriptional regulator n=1 Tax=Nocardia jejuensis TaxID=328049 RepID=UPI0009FD7F4C|nr:IclR family transcriptional regulator [Nocardia jejuensis]
MTIIDSGKAVGERPLPPSMVERMTLILDTFDGRTSQLSLDEIVGRTRLPRSTVYRILGQMLQLHWIEHAARGYRLGRRALGIGGDDGRGEIRKAAAPVLHTLHLRTGLVAHLNVLVDGESEYLDKVGGRHATRVPTRVGGRAGAHTTAGGRSMLAWLTPEVVDDLYARTSRDYSTEELSCLHYELDRIRRRGGLAFDRDDAPNGFAWVGAAVRDEDGPAAAISLCGDARTAQPERVAPLVLAAARAVSRVLYPADSAARVG